jgi:hypothetical protein
LVQCIDAATWCLTLAEKQIRRTIGRYTPFAAYTQTSHKNCPLSSQMILPRIWQNHISIHSGSVRSIKKDHSHAVSSAMVHECFGESLGVGVRCCLKFPDAYVHPRLSGSCMAFLMDKELHTPSPPQNTTAWRGPFHKGSL